MEPEMNDPRPPKPAFPTEKRELLLGLLLLILGICLVNSVFFAGFYLGFAIFAGLALVCGVIYLLSRGGRLTLYSGSLLAMSLVIIAAFARSDDAFVKFVLVCFLVVAANLGLCLLAGKNRRESGGLLSLLDMGVTAFARPFGGIPRAFRGLTGAFRGSGSAGKAGGAVAIGLLVAIPLLAVLIPLLISADAAFDGLLSLLPEMNIGEIIVSLLFGLALGLYLYLRSTALAHGPQKERLRRPRRGINALTVHTVLCAVAAVYVAYLLSQLAYFAGGFSGILPEEFTMAEYARRGFFEMAWICAINLAVIALAVGLIQKKEGRTHLLTKLLCLFIGVVTLFLVVSASAKMLLYIDSFGLTRLRVLTEVIMVFLGLATATVCLWICLPRLPYMKVVLLMALVMGAAVAWADVDTQVAKYNVTAYQSGKLEAVDVDYLGRLGAGAVPQIAKLTQDSDPYVAKEAMRMLHARDLYGDFRGWHHTGALAERHITNSGVETMDLQYTEWTYYLPNDYAILRNSYWEIVCVKAVEDGSVLEAVLDQHVVAFCYDTQYVGLQCVDVDAEDPFDLSNPGYYLLDTVTGQLTGPMTAGEFPLTEGWIPTRLTPNGAE